MIERIRTVLHCRSRREGRRPAPIEETLMEQTRQDAMLDCPLCERPHSQFTTEAELAEGLGWQALHQCPDGRAKVVAGETREKAVEAWNFYCESQRRK
jgi:hypothetical protein